MSAHKQLSPLVLVTLQFVPTYSIALEGLMRKADKALYQARNQGRNRLVIYAD